MKATVLALSAPAMSIDVSQVGALSSLLFNTFYHFYDLFYFKEEIVCRAEQSFKEGVCELWLTSEDTGTYGRDIGTSLPDLLWKLVDVIPEGRMMRVGMTNPPYILEHLEVFFSF